MEPVTMTKEQFDKLKGMESQMLEWMAKQEKEKNDAIRKEEMEKLIEAALLSKHPPEKKIIFGGEPKENEKKIGFIDFLKGVKNGDPILKTTVMSEGTDAQGGYAVPIEYGNEIFGALNNIAKAPGAVSVITQNTKTKNWPKWLTDLTVYWVDEDATKTLTKPTLGQITMTLKKICAIVPFTDELLEDNISNLDKQVATLYGENCGLELERVILDGSVAGGDAFNGITNATGVLATAQAGPALQYDDLIDGLISNTTMLERYHTGAKIWLSRTVMNKIWKLKDANNLPYVKFTDTNVLGVPYVITDQLATTKAIYGNLKYVLLGRRSGNTGINVAVSNSAVAPSSGSVTQNAFMQDETWFRFTWRNGIVVAVPAAFAVLTSIA